MKIIWRVINCAVHKERLKKIVKDDLPRVTRVSCINGGKFTDNKKKRC